MCFDKTYLCVLNCQYGEHGAGPTELPSARFALSLLNNLSVEADIYLSSAQSQILHTHMRKHRKVIPIKPQLNLGLCTALHSALYMAHSYVHHEVSGANGAIQHCTSAGQFLTIILLILSSRSRKKQSAAQMCLFSDDCRQFQARKWKLEVEL